MEFLSWWYGEHPAEFLLVASLLIFAGWVLFRAAFETAGGGTARRTLTSLLTVALLLCTVFAGVWLTMIGMDWSRGYPVDLSKAVAGVPGYAYVFTAVIVAAIRSRDQR